MLTIAEESTAWPAVSRPTDDGGLGFGFKWNMGWMHDTLDYFARDPVTASTTTTSSPSACSTRSPRTSCCRSPTTRWCTARARCSTRCRATAGSASPTCARSTAYMWAHPGKKLLFMGGELARSASGTTTAALDWHLLDAAEHAGVQALVRDLNRAYRASRALWERDYEPRVPAGSTADDAEPTCSPSSARGATGTSRGRACANLSPVPRDGYRLGLPARRRWTRDPEHRRVALRRLRRRQPRRRDAEPSPWHGQPHSAPLTLPPLAVRLARRRTRAAG